VLNTMIASVAERAREIGVLRALGWRKRRIVRMIVGEASALGIGGAVAGGAAGVLVLQLLHVLPQTSGIVDARFPLGVVCQAAALAMIAGIAGAAYPAYWAAKLNPADALHRR
jgi:putative ABC transport system permease protein